MLLNNGLIYQKKKIINISHIYLSMTMLSRKGISCILGSEKLFLSLISVCCLKLSISILWLNFQFLSHSGFLVLVSCFPIVYLLYSNRNKFSLKMNYALKSINLTPLYKFKLKQVAIYFNLTSFMIVAI